MQPNYVRMPYNLHYGYLSFDLETNSRQKLPYTGQRNLKPRSKAKQETLTIYINPSYQMINKFIHKKLI